MSGHRDPDATSDRATAILPMALAAVSGCIVGVLLRGEVVEALLFLAIALVSGVAGWWARGIR